MEWCLWFLSWHNTRIQMSKDKIDMLISVSGYWLPRRYIRTSVKSRIVKISSRKERRFSCTKKFAHATFRNFIASRSFTTSLINELLSLKLPLKQPLTRQLTRTLLCPSIHYPPPNECRINERFAYLWNLFTADFLHTHRCCIKQ